MIKKALRLLKTFTVARVVGMLAFIFILAALVVGIIIISTDVAVLNPQGIIAEKQKSLIIFTTLLGMVIIIPVFFLLFLFAWRYRAGNRKRRAKFTPDSGGNIFYEMIWWGIPLIIIVILGVVTWISTHDLDPYKKIASENKPVKVQVVALQWKWLFIYPEENFASLNELRIPVDTPIELEVTADAPMSTLWIPSLGGQIYAMKGMATQLNLMSGSEGEYFGTNTNINGEGYSKMTFDVISMSEIDYSNWIYRERAKLPTVLDWTSYQKLVQPSDQREPEYFSVVDEEIFANIVDQYMGHGNFLSNEEEHNH